MNCAKRVILMGLIALVLSAAVVTAEGKQEEGVTVEFFQNKLEAVDTFDALARKFEQENPGVKIQQNQVPEAETVLMSRLSRNKLPESMGIGGNATYGEIAAAGVLMPWNGKEAAGKVHTPYVRMTQRLAGDMEKIYGIPYTANANTVLYNKDKFAELGLEVPMTWSQLIAAAEKIKAAGEVPFYLTFKDAWTAMVPWNSLAANLQGDDFFEKLAAGETSFSERYRGVAEKMLTLLKYGHDDNFGFGYTDGNQAFARGESFMYIQGVWAIGEIKKVNPDINLGVFALPVLEDASKNRLVSGVDTLFAISASAKNEDVAEDFINFLLRPENAEYFINEQRTFSAVKGVIQDDPVMEGIRPYFEEGRITFFPDHYYPTGMQVANLVQEFLLNGDVDAFLLTLDTEYQKVISR